MSALGRVLAALLLALLVAGAADARAWSWLGVRSRDLSEQEMDELASRHGIIEGDALLVPAVHTYLAIDADPADPGTARFAEAWFGAAGGKEGPRPLRKALPVRLVNMPRRMVGEQIAAAFGFVLRETETVSERPSASAPTVTFVVRGTAAERAGLEVGDVILQVNDLAVLTRDAAREALSEVPTDRPLHLTVRRDDRHVALTLAAPDNPPKP